MKNKLVYIDNPSSLTQMSNVPELKELQTEISETQKSETHNLIRNSFERMEPNIDANEGFTVVNGRVIDSKQSNEEENRMFDFKKSRTSIYNVVDNPNQFKSRLSKIQSITFDPGLNRKSKSQLNLSRFIMEQTGEKIAVENSAKSIEVDKRKSDIQPKLDYKRINRNYRIFRSIILFIYRINVMTKKSKMYGLPSHEINPHIRDTTKILSRLKDFQITLWIEQQQTLAKEKQILLPDHQIFLYVMIVYLVVLVYFVIFLPYILVFSVNNYSILVFESIL